MSARITSFPHSSSRALARGRLRAWASTIRAGAPGSGSPCCVPVRAGLRLGSWSPLGSTFWRSKRWKKKFDSSPNGIFPIGIKNLIDARALVLLLALLPLFADAQSPPQKPRIPEINAPLNATTLAVLRANQPKNMSWEEWMRIMQSPDGTTLYPLRVTQAMLDTLDGREMDLRFRYILVRE